jgi:hypothetical protein
MQKSISENTRLLLFDQLKSQKITLDNFVDFDRQAVLQSPIWGFLFWK